MKIQNFPYVPIARHGTGKSGISVSGNTGWNSLPIWPNGRNCGRYAIVPACNHLLSAIVSVHICHLSLPYRNRTGIYWYRTDIGYCDVDTDADADVVSRMYQILNDFIYRGSRLLGCTQSSYLSGNLSSSNEKAQNCAHTVQSNRNAYQHCRRAQNATSDPVHLYTRISYDTSYRYEHHALLAFNELLMTSMRATHSLR